MAHYPLFCREIFRRSIFVETFLFRFKMPQLFNRMTIFIGLELNFNKCEIFCCSGDPELGSRRISDICLLAFLSSIRGVKKLVSLLLNSKDNELIIHHYNEASAVWDVENENETPTIPQFQTNWDINIKRIIANDLILTYLETWLVLKLCNAENLDLSYMQYLLLILLLF
jgi:hypothetical protein